MHCDAPSKNYQIIVQLLVMLGLLPLGIILTYVVCSKIIRIRIVVVIYWVGCVCNQS